MVTFTESDIDMCSPSTGRWTSCATARAERPAEVRELIAGDRLPHATYVLPVGEARYPPDYLALVDEAGGVDAFPARFRDRYLAAGSSPSAAADAGVTPAGPGTSSGFGRGSRRRSRRLANPSGTPRHSLTA